MNKIRFFLITSIALSMILTTEFYDLNHNGLWDPGEDLINNKQNKFITIGGSVTEVVFKLGLGASVVGVDASSSFPKRVKDLPQVGYHRSISSEGILSMMPTKIIATTDMGPPVAVKQIKNSGVDVEIYNSPKSIDDIINLIDDIAILFDVKKNANLVKDQMYAFKQEIDNICLKYKKPPKVAFFMNPSTGSYSAAGANTNANYLIELIGGVNVFKNDFHRYQKVSKEQILKYNPDLILVASYSKKESASFHFLNGLEFQSLKSVKKDNVIDIKMSDLTMGPSFVSNALSILNKVKIDSK
tara:strand:- start:866 stop:1765 length:900 start_codon:yes stop_codon:yes gene_type:complete